MDPLRRPAISFAHRGASAHAPDNTIEGFRLALRLGATGLESDVRLTADGVPVLHHDRNFKAGLRRRSLAAVQRAQLPPHIPTLAGLYEECGSEFELSLDVCDTGAVGATVDIAREAGAERRLWLCHPDWEELARWREKFDDVRLVNSTRMKALRAGPERRAAQLADAGIDAINLHHTDWTGGYVTLFHRFSRLAFAWDAQHERIVRALVGMGIDGVYSDHVDRLVEVIRPAGS